MFAVMKTYVATSSLLVVACWAALGVAAIGQEKEDGMATLDVGNVVFRYDAETWTAKDPPRAMTQGGLTTGKEGHRVDADFYHFGKGQGGSVQDNLKRWKGQFSGEPKIVEESTFADGKVTFIHLEGTFLSGPPFGQKTPMENQAMLGAILPSAEGAVFVKMVGDKSDVAAAVKAFKALVTTPFVEKAT